MINRKIRIEKIAIKDVKMRTFITEDVSRNEMVQHVYDITYGTVEKGVDTLVVIDDSIVRGTTLKESIVTHAGQARTQKDHCGFFRSADPVSRLLWHRHEQAGRFYRFSRGY